ncbi:hypothetical protein S100390_v1c06290 [Spiroplasma sp. NBRC 100390]|uniref:hypothetical protein n=1 Tax=unclassified Spiroplasma TaxID=2637901 RepID=UPI0008927E78|nr:MULTISPECIES: hypothetical protein [unclassified Spiroplasma]AOX43966.1 hypothetical protein STU14_v1c06290 [Spiroplasma sp. TU-14]APE13436.1 hypothetical protein S100390_v1c06290 [Spiroplasma sp. NBRC 100390]
MKKLISLLGAMTIVGAGMPAVIANTTLEHAKTELNIAKQDNVYDWKVKVVPVPSELPLKILVTAGDWGTTRLESTSFTLNLGKLKPEQIKNVANADYGNTYTEHHVPSWGDKGHASYQAGMDHLGFFESCFYEKQGSYIISKTGRQILLDAQGVKDYGNNNWSDTIELDLARHHANGYVLYAWEKNSNDDLILTIAVALEVWASWTSTEGIAAVYVDGNINIYYD